MAEKDSGILTTPDLVVLSLLAERAMHGYQLNAVLTARDVRDWAGISRPQVYYSLKKLANAKLIKPTHSEGSGGPERQEFATTPAGLRALAEALEREDWAKQRSIPPFLTWMALSTHASRAAVRQQIIRRREYLTTELARERETLKSFENEVGEMVQVGGLMVELTIKHFEIELEWLDKVKKKLL
ncbi:MAG TPA: PadR family transcriptional regulator [Blastocatellia bacterium]|nr:PadR family transcriptional regulator [Blastocatellia bacterium]